MTLAKNRVYLFWDNSNLFVPLHYVAASEGESAQQYDVRLQFDHLFGLARGGREVQRGYCVGSVPPDLGQVWLRLESAGLEVETFERGSESRREQAVDQALQAQMLRVLADVDEPGVAVLMTGDGAGYDEGVGFHADLERFHKKGWGIEVISWESACSRALKNWASTNGVFIPLERFYKQVTFVQGGRKSAVLSMKGRQWAEPRRIVPATT